MIVGEKAAGRTILMEKALLLVPGTPRLFSLGPVDEQSIDIFRSGPGLGGAKRHGASAFGGGAPSWGCVTCRMLSGASLDAVS